MHAVYIRHLWIMLPNSFNLIIFSNSVNSQNKFDNDNVDKVIYWMKNRLLKGLIPVRELEISETKWLRFLSDHSILSIHLHLDKN